jgi:hypothetical protein
MAALEKMLEDLNTNAACGLRLAHAILPATVPAHTPACGG